MTQKHSYVHSTNWIKYRSFNKSIIFSCVCFCAYMCLSVCTCVCARGQPQASSIILCFNFWERVSHWARAWQFSKTGWPEISKAHPVSIFLELGLPSCNTLAPLLVYFTWVLSCEFGASCLQVKHFTGPFPCPHSQCFMLLFQNWGLILMLHTCWEGTPPLSYNHSPNFWEKIWPC